MSSRLIRLLAALVLPLAMAAGCLTDDGGQRGGGNAPRADSLRSLIPEGVDPGVVALGPQDMLEIRVFREADLSGPFRISQAGTIEFPLIGEVRAQGLTTSELEQTIATRLRDGGFLVSPSVTVVLTESNSQKVFILGQVERPGTYPYEARMTIVQLVSMAGGFKDTAARNNTTVTRRINEREVRVTVPVEDISQGRAANFVLLPGDIVNVPDSWL